MSAAFGVVSVYKDRLICQKRHGARQIVCHKEMQYMPAVHMKRNGVSSKVICNDCDRDLTFNVELIVFYCKSQYHQPNILCEECLQNDHHVFTIVAHQRNVYR